VNREKFVGKKTNMETFRGGKKLQAGKRKRKDSFSTRAKRRGSLNKSKVVCGKKDFRGKKGNLGKKKT